MSKGPARCLRRQLRPPSREKANQTSKSQAAEPPGSRRSSYQVMPRVPSPAAATLAWIAWPRTRETATGRLQLRPPSLEREARTREECGEAMSFQATVGTPWRPTVTEVIGRPRATVPASGSIASLALPCAIGVGRDQVRPPSTERAAPTPALFGPPPFFPPDAR